MKKIFFFALLLSSTTLSAQEDDLLSLLGEEKTTDYATASFKSNRVINGHSIENAAYGVMDMKISHRFSPIRNGLYDMFGLDGASIRIGLDYGVSNRLMIGLGRNSNEKIIDGFIKYKILRQCSGKKNVPITLAYLVDAQVKTVKFAETERDYAFSSRLYYTHQLLVGRKFTDRFSLQLMPTLIHRNLVETTADKNDVLALGVAGRIKLNKRLALTGEYYHVFDERINDQYAPSLSVGLDIETGGHVFQLHFTNANDMTYKGFITETSEAWFFKNDADKMLSGIRFGFNVSRVFTIRKPKGLD
jgi:Membrane bound beta barrel domain (DUF5777)